MNKEIYIISVINHFSDADNSNIRTEAFTSKDEAFNYWKNEASDKINCLLDYSKNKSLMEQILQRFKDGKGFISEIDIPINAYITCNIKTESASLYINYYESNESELVILKKHLIK